MPVSSYRFFMKNATLAYFVFLGELWSVLSLTLGFFRAFGFLVILLDFFSGPGGDGHTSRHSYILVGSEDQILEENILWLSSLNLTDIPYNGVSLTQNLVLGHIKYVLSNGAELDYSENISKPDSCTVTLLHTRLPVTKQP